MSLEYIHTPPPDEIYFIVHNAEMTIKHYGTLTAASNHLGHALTEREIHTDKQAWIDRMDELGIDLREQHPMYIGRFIDRDLPPYRPVKLEETT